MVDYAKKADSKTYCIHYARDDYDTAQALYEIHFKMTTSGKGHELIKAFFDAQPPPFSLEIYAQDQTLSQCYVTSGPAQRTLGAFFHTINPFLQVKEVPDFFESLEDEGMFAVGNVSYKTWDVYPSEDYRNTAVAPMQNYLQPMAQVPSKFKVVFQMSMVRTPASFRLHGYLWFWRQIDRVRHYLRPKYWFKRGVRPTQVEWIIDKTKRKFVRANLRIGICLEGEEGVNGGEALKQEMRQHLDSILVGLAMLNLPDFNGYKFHSVKFGKEEFAKMARREIGYWKPTICTTLTELAAWWTYTVTGGLNLKRAIYRELAPPEELLDLDEFKGEKRGDISVFGKTNYRSQEMDIGILREDRDRHLFMLGTGGSGKSNLIKLLIKEDLANSHGCGLIDPYGDMTEEVLKLVPEHRIDDVVVFDPTDAQYPPSLNPFDYVEGTSRMRVAAGLVEIFKSRFKEQWSELLEILLTNAILALLSTQWTTILSIKKMITDPAYRDALVPKIKDEVVRYFWESYFPIILERDKKTVIDPLLQIVNEFVAQEILSNSLGQPFNKFDFREIIDSRKILLMKIPKDQIGSDSSALLSSMIITRIYQAAMSRADIPYEQRKDFYLYIDSFNDFATSSFEEILSESRKYRLNLTLSSPSLSLLPSGVRESIFGNVGTLISFRANTEDAPIITREFNPKIEDSDVTSLPPHHFYIKMPIRSKAQRVFSGKTIESILPLDNFSERCVQNSRESYCLPRDQAVNIINTWSKVG